MRKYEHRYKAYYEDGKDYNSPFYRAIRKYGWDSLKYEVLNTAYSDTIEDLTSNVTINKPFMERKEKISIYGALPQ